MEKFKMNQFHGLKARRCRPLQAEPRHDGWPLLSQQISGSVFTVNVCSVFGSRLSAPIFLQFTQVFVVCEGARSGG